MHVVQLEIDMKYKLHIAHARKMRERCAFLYGSDGGVTIMSRRHLTHTKRRQSGLITPIDLYYIEIIEIIDKIEIN